VTIELGAMAGTPPALVGCEETSRAAQMRALDPHRRETIRITEDPHPSVSEYRGAADRIIRGGTRSE